MAQDRTVHSKNLEGNRWRDLDVYYDKGGINYWNYEQKPKGTPPMSALLKPPARKQENAL